jgi:porin
MAGLVTARERDELGVAIAVGHNSSHFAAQQSGAGSRAGRVEATLECSYLAPLTSKLAIQPDLQYVLHPNTDLAIRNAFVALLHFELSF